MNLDAALDNLAQGLLGYQEIHFQIELVFRLGAIHEAQILGNGIVEDQAADGGVNQPADVAFGHPDLDLGVEGDNTVLIGHQSLVDIPEDLAFTGLAILHQSQVIGAQNHVLRRNSYGAAVRRLQKVVGSQHQEPGLGLRFCGQRNVNSHLVAVEVGVVSRTGQRMQLQGAPFHQNRLKGLNAQTVQGRCTVQQDGMILDDDLKGVPDFWTGPIHHFTGGFDVVGSAGLHQTLHDEGLEELQSHLLRKTALIHFQLRPDDDNRTSGIVDTLAQQVLTEPSLFALQHIGKGLQRPVVGAGNRASPAAVVDQGVNGFLQHPLLVADDDVRGVQLQQVLQPVVAVDNPAIEVV